MAFSQAKLVEGKIIDKDTKQPIPFASIGLLGTSKGTSSNLNGQFSLSVIDNFSIRVSCLGYRTLQLDSIPKDQFVIVELEPSATQLKEIVVFNKQVNARKVVNKAFRSISDNFNTDPFFQKFFYRHYCKDDSVYGRLIEASVDVWKRKGYKSTQSVAGITDEIRVTQLRRSFDMTKASQGHTPIAIKNILQADIAGYQANAPSDHISFFAEVSSLKADAGKYDFTYEGLTYYDGKEVYEIGYNLRKDSVLTTQGYELRPGNKGSLFISTKDYVFVKLVDVKFWDQDTIKTTTYYTPYKGNYYPYHLIRDGNSVARNGSTHLFHVEMMATEILTEGFETFYGDEPGKFDLLKIPHDSIYWSNNTILKTTPLEDVIISDLGGGESLSEQFKRYQHQELNQIESGKADDRFNWFKNENKDKKIIYLTFWNSDCLLCLQQIEYQKKLIKKYKENVAFVLLSIDKDEAKWKRTIEKYNLKIDGFTNFRIGEQSTISQMYNLTQIPRTVIIDKSGNDFKVNAGLPNDVALKKDFDLLISDKNE
ncbi:hypothetical protein SanaruYs_03530 [Chryseotalea sanaruensis]|uniref:Thioredoxin domain-containing protein n=2 Tax=Chryseotalea sanaruensis TaxID=2482724 RepID=A0A401U5D1_9BACT|nr:hypothetical protein SanaruYs_03530 [Chryseotalea sanaruensis]